MKSKKSNIIKWYEYKMSADGDEDTGLESEEMTEVSENPDDTDEEVDMSGLNEDAQALVEDILARFKEAKQNSVDSLFEEQEAMEKATMSQEDIIASICAPKQNNVDDLVKQARE